jgi:xanthine dehydrogenase iron-sulfur cluster and FAD-binding subunit A
MTIYSYLNTTTCNDERFESQLAFPKVQQILELATDSIEQKNIVTLPGKQAGSLTPEFWLSIVSLISSRLTTSSRQLVKIFLPKFQYCTNLSPIFRQLLKQK